MSEILRVYFDSSEIGPDGYPWAWHRPTNSTVHDEIDYEYPAVKDLIRQQAGNRCERCAHPYEKGMGEWSPCDRHCTHDGPVRVDYDDYAGTGGSRSWTEAQWRILTVHHLNGVKHDLRWWNLAALCQRCHLTIQAKVHMQREWNRPHAEWFKIHAAGFYAAELLGEELTREETFARLDELLDLQLTQHPLPGFA